MRKILIVDDDKNFLTILKDAMTGYTDKYDFVFASSGSKAMEILDTQDLDLIISDLRMPDVDGLQLLTHVMETKPFIPFVLMTAYGAPPIKSEAMSIGAIRYLEKPITLKELISTIEDIFQGEFLEGLSIPYVSLLDIIQLLHLEHRTCTLTVKTTSGDKGFLTFIKGDLVDARTKANSGEEAALEIFQWKYVHLSIRKKTGKETKISIETPLEKLILKALNIRRREIERDLKDKEKETTKKEVIMPVNYEKILETFREIPGYKASGITNINGELMAFDALRDEAVVKMFFIHMASFFVAGDKTAEKTHAGELYFIQADTDTGKFLARRGEKAIAMILLEKEGNVAIAKEALEEAAAEL